MIFMFDTHCHLNFRVFEGKVRQVIKEAKESDVNYFVVPGTDIETSKKAVEIAQKFNGVFAAVGIHPHHINQIQNSNLKSQNENLNLKIKELEKIITFPKVVAVGEIGLDKYIYQKTKYKNYQVNDDFIEFQKIFFIEQLKLAKKYKKPVIIHNRQAKKDLLDILNANYHLLNTNIVFHCCEPDDELLNFAIKNKIFIGVDGDVTYNKKKQEFVKKIPLNLLLLETDSPFLKPRVTSLIRSDKNVTEKERVNEPKNLLITAYFVSKILKKSFDEIAEKTTKNGKKFFNLQILSRS